MTNRERIINTLLRKPADRAPFGLGLGFTPWGSTYQRWCEETGISDLNPADHFGYDPDFQIVPAEYGPWPHFPSKVLAEDEEYVTSTDFRGLTMRNRRDGNSMPEFIDYPVKSPSDWERYKQEHLQTEVQARLSRLSDFLVTAQQTDAPVQVGCFPWGVFGTARDLMGAEELLVGFYTEAEMVRDIMETWTDVWLKLYAEIAKHTPIDHVHIWEDMSGRNGSLISMKMVEDFMMPCYDRIAEFVRAHSIPLLSVDTDGLVNQLVPTMMGHGVNVFFPFEVQAGNDIVEYRKLYPEIGIMGGLDKNALADNMPSKAMHKELDRAEVMLAEGGYVPGCDHLIPPNVPWRKWEWFVTELRKLIGV